jgi:hypothetical protein
MANIKRANTSGITKSGVAIPDVPDAPTIGAATNVGTARAFNNGSATVAFTAAAKGGTSTSFTATSTPGSFTVTGAGSPLTVTGLQSATSYTFAVTGTNASATGPASGASSSITATTIPETPTIGTVTRTGNTTVSVPFTGATGGSSLTSGTVTSSPSISLSTSGTSSPLTATGTFIQGQSYTFTTTVTNANGTSGSSGSSNSVIPFAATAPAAPTIGTVSVTNATTVSVPYTDGAANGSAITSRTITSSPSIALTFTNTSASPVTVTGSFVAGTAYTFSLTATNGVGTSSSSSASNSTTPNPIPRAGFMLSGVLDPGGSPQFVSSIIKILYSSDTVSTLGSSTATISQNRGAMSNSGTAGYSAGGTTGSDGYDKVTYATDTCSGSASYISPVAGGRCGVANWGTAGYFVSGDFGTTDPSSGPTTIQKIAFSNDARSTLSTTVTTAFRAPGGGFENSGTAGYMVAGSDMGSKFGTTVNKIRKLTYSTETYSVLANTFSFTGNLNMSWSNSGTAGLATSNSSVYKMPFSTETSAFTIAPTDGFIGHAGNLANSGTAGYSNRQNRAQITKYAFSNDTASLVSATLPATRANSSCMSNSG